VSRPGRRSLADRLGLGLSLVSLVIGMSAVQPLQAASPLDEPRHSPNGRLEAERLAAVQASVDSLAARRRNLLPRMDGLLDLRSVFHAHAGDSSHTGGTPEEMLAAAKQAGVRVVFLSDHFRPPRDYMDSWRGLRDGVLFIPGSEARGFLLHPEASVFPLMDKPVPELVPAVVRGEGMAFLSHIEERPDHPMTGLTGLEIYNRHYDAKRDFTGMLQLVLRLTDPERLKELSELLRRFPDACLAAQCLYPQAYLDKWDASTATGRFTGVAANDCHHNMVLLVKKVDDTAVLVGTNVDKDSQMRRIPVSLAPGIKELVAGKKPGEVIARADLDPYHRSFAGSSTHLFAKELTTESVRAAVRKGRVYVSHDWICNPAGFWVSVVNGQDQPVGMIGDDVKLQISEPLRMKVALPAPALVRLVCDGKVVAESEGKAEVAFPIEKPGVYRVEAFQKLDGEYRGWIYANPVYIVN